MLLHPQLCYNMAPHVKEAVAPEEVLFEDVILTASDILNCLLCSVGGTEEAEMAYGDGEGQVLSGFISNKSLFQTEMLSTRFIGDELEYSLKKPFSKSGVRASERGPNHQIEIFLFYY